MSTRTARQSDFEQYRSTYSKFIIHPWSLSEHESGASLTFQYEIPGLRTFTSSYTFEFAADRRRVHTHLSERLISCLAAIDALSYWKCCCCPHIEFRAPHPPELAWWERLYHDGLGEFRFRNSLTTDVESFVRISGETEAKDDNPPLHMHGNCIPIGGGKDSVVTLRLLKDSRDSNTPFFLNPIKASIETARVAGYSPTECVLVRRPIDYQLLELNAEGFLNGHTPFSALLAFLTLFAARTHGLEHIVLSNESSSNEGNLGEDSVNHQFSKSYDFEDRFRTYVGRHLPGPNYFSLLRPINEVQIARLFGEAKEFFSAFQSCNVGSKTGVWCGRCPKCVFVCLILGPFVSREQLKGIFAKDMFEDAALAPTAEALIGVSSHKPFECVGTFDETRAALHALCNNPDYADAALLRSLRQYVDKSPGPPLSSFLEDWNNEHALPEQFVSLLRSQLQ